MESPEYWNDIAEQFGHDRQSATWRVYMQQCYTALVRRWFADAPSGATLKTDLFEEAVTPHHLFGALGDQAAGMDVSLSVVRAASTRLQREQGAHNVRRLIVADARALPWATGSFARVLSGSSLDHFPRHADIEVALAELVRCLAPGGCLVVTFDNPHNPLVRLRNALPFHWLARIRLVPYYVGATYDRGTAVRVLTALGLRVTHVGTMAHAPRAPAIWASDRHARHALTGSDTAVSSALLRALHWWDRWLDGSPLEFLSGYYLAVRAVKPVGDGPMPEPPPTG